MQKILLIAGHDKSETADLGCILLETGGAGAIWNVFKTSNFVYYQG